MEEPLGVRQRTKRNHCFPLSQWAKELDYRLIKELWAFTGNHIAVRFAYEWHDDSVTGIAPMAMKTGNSMMTGSWPHGLRQSTTFPFWNQIRKYHWPLGRRPKTTQD